MRSRIILRYPEGEFLVDPEDRKVPAVMVDSEEEFTVEDSRSE